MANTFNNIKDAPGIIARAAAQTLKDNLAFCDTIEKADADDFNGKNGYKAGDTIQTSIPARYVPQQSFDITSSIQDHVEEKKPLALDVISTIGTEIDTFEFATEVELQNTIKRFVVPAAESIAQDVEQRFIEKMTQATYNSTGTAGSNQFLVSDVLAGRTKLNENLSPRGDRSFLLNSDSGAKAVDARKGLFQDSTEIAEQYRMGMVGRADGFDWYENELLYTHVNGTSSLAAVTVAGAPAEGANTLSLSGLTATTGTITKGSTFTIDGIFMVHPITKKPTSKLQQFVVTADVTADGAGNATVSISPNIYAASNGLQNVTALPSGGESLTFQGSADGAYTNALQYHKSAYKMVSVPLIMPEAVEIAAQETVDGITVAVIRAFDVLERRMVTRLDFLGGISDVRPEWGNRVWA